MKQINTLLTIIALTLALTPTLQAINVNPASGPYTVGQLIYFSGTAMYWDEPWVGPRISFGDGNVNYSITHSNAVAHRYRQPGIYNLILWDDSPYTTPMPSEYLTITIVDTRRITYSPANPIIGQTITFTAENFVTPKNIRWDFGDGVIVSQHQDSISPNAGHQVTHSYSLPGNYTVRAYDWDGTDTVPVTLIITIGQPNRSISSSIPSPREDQPTELRAINFISKVIDWDFGDGERVSDSAIQTHRFMREGQVSVSALDRDYTQTPTTLTIRVRPENRSLTANPPVVKLNQPVILNAQNFRWQGVLWDFGDGTQYIGSRQETHTYARPGRYTVNARDERGGSQRNFSTEVTVRGITDEVSLHKAELHFDNGRAFRVVPKNSQLLQAELQLKMEGSGLITGIWLVDGIPFTQFSQLARQGEVSTIKTGLNPPLPTIDPGLHRLTVQLTRPGDITLPEISYFVEAGSAMLDILAPDNGATVKEDEPPRFKWSPVRGASWYELGFADSLFPFLYSPETITWQTVREGNECAVETALWASIPRNSTAFWQIRALDSNRQIISQSEPREIRLTLNPAQIIIAPLTDLSGKELSLSQVPLPRQVLITGQISFPGETKFLMLRVFADDRMVNQLLFRNVSPDKQIPFTSSAPARGHRRITLQVLKPSTPAVVIGVHHIELTR